MGSGCTVQGVSVAWCKSGERPKSTLQPVGVDLFDGQERVKEVRNNQATDDQGRVNEVQNSLATGTQNSLTCGAQNGLAELGYLGYL